MKPRPKRAPIAKVRVTLDRVLSKLGIASRETTREWIRKGRLKVNGRVVRNPDQWVEPVLDTVHLDGKRIRAEKKIYLALNKPTGVVTSYGDARGRKTVYDCLQDFDRWVFPVGRLDLDTSGLLILTNDSEFAEALLQPGSKVPKTYYAKVNGSLNADAYFRIAFGLDIGRGERSGAAHVRELRTTGRFTWIELIITEGKNRQVRRMLEAVGHRVAKLVRTKIGDLELGDLAVGEHRELDDVDRRKLLHGGLRIRRSRESL